MTTIEGGMVAGRNRDGAVAEKLYLIHARGRERKRELTGNCS